MAHGILKGRTADILTDACRAQLLHILGYRTELIEFIDSKHTPKKHPHPRKKKPPEQVIQPSSRSIAPCADFWHIKPSLEQLLTRELAPFLS